MEYTNNEKFSKPDKNDLYSLALWNENTEKTDAALAIAGKPDEYSAAKTYAVGDKCIYENALYKCITAISTAEAWTAGHWAKTSLCAEDTANKAAIKELTENKANKDHSHAWSAITGKPSSFTPASHTHDDRYFTESEINNKLKDLVITKDFTSSKVTVAAQSAKQVAISFNVPSGYKMLNNVIVKTNGAVLLAYFAQRDGSVLTCYMYNFTNASATCTLTATVPFIKS